MPKLSKAPLVEVIFELRWQGPPECDDDPVRWAREDTFLIADFRDQARLSGYGDVEVLEAPPAFVPHALSHRFHLEDEKSPCYQLGLGIFTANVTNEFYDWAKYKDCVVNGLGMLSAAMHRGLDTISGLSLGLKYVDAFQLSEGQTPRSFMQQNLRVKLNKPEDMLPDEGMSNQGERVDLSLISEVSNPVSTLFYRLQSGKVNGQDALVATTTLRSVGKTAPSKEIDAYAKWLDEAHRVQKHVFDRTLEKSYMESCK